MIIVTRRCCCSSCHTFLHVYCSISSRAITVSLWRFAPCCAVFGDPTADQARLDRHPCHPTSWFHLHFHTVPKLLPLLDSGTAIWLWQSPCQGWNTAPCFVSESESPSNQVWCTTAAATWCLARVACMSCYMMLSRTF